jgi:hypothetical protein
VFSASSVMEGDLQILFLLPLWLFSCYLLSLIDGMVIVTHCFLAPAVA